MITISKTYLAWPTGCNKTYDSGTRRRPECGRRIPIDRWWGGAWGGGSSSPSGNQSATYAVSRCIFAIGALPQVARLSRTRSAHAGSSQGCRRLGSRGPAAQVVAKGRVKGEKVCGERRGIRLSPTPALEPQLLSPVCARLRHSNCQRPCARPFDRLFPSSSQQLRQFNGLLACHRTRDRGENRVRIPGVWTARAIERRSVDSPLSRVTSARPVFAKSLSRTTLPPSETFRYRTTLAVFPYVRKSQMSQERNAPRWARPIAWVTTFSGRATGCSTRRKDRSGS